MIELYEFKIAGDTYRYCTGMGSVSYGGNTYTPEAITRNEIAKEFDNASASISLPIHLEPAPKYRVLNPATVVWVTIMREDGTKIFIGKIGGVSFDMKKAVATMKLVSIQGMMKSKIPTRTYSASCSYECFDSDCALSALTFKTTLFSNDIEISSDYTQISSPKIAAKVGGYFAGGYAKCGYEASYIISSVGDTIKLLFPLQLWTPSMTIELYPGCDKTLNTCKSKFNNESNYGGYPFIPDTNPVTEGF